ncbi:FAD-dependent oxidoreductase [Paraburkholderia sp. NMBU_R16]|uniref:FAD-dependent oxidoreductase n=1 Tax=Paraburkholderia sp. NMBU_R16 TaxID=2698676 RepID=UPI001567A4E4|nr:FAD-dependent oxidoreductase [Paraburkholderia sp. NMBU_R16]NRO97537.1 FAD-dependent oxidoreductase [Paraburkholderia sp. NMBU_R16]
MDVIVIGGGVVGVATAYQLHSAGHRVCVIERHATVAQGATYGHGGALLPTPLDVWFGPTFVPNARVPRSGLVYKPGFNGSTRRFMQRLAAFQEPDAFRDQYRRLGPLVDLSRETLAALETRFDFEFEQRSGMLHVVQHPREWELAQSALDLLREFEIQHQVLTARECADLEHSIPTDPEFAGGVFFEHERLGNCPLFTKLVKQVLEEQAGVRFMFGRAVEALRLDEQRAAVELAPVPSERASAREVDVVSADAIVVAAGAGSLPLIERATTNLPLHPARFFALTAPIAYEECVPHVAVVDTIRRITMTRVNQRVRVAGAALVQPEREIAKPAPEPLATAATALLAQATHDWIPGAAKISAAHSWDGVQLLSPDGLPVVGRASHPRLFVNLAHGPAGWGLACGSAKVLAEIISGTEPSVPPDTLAALRADRFAS